MRTFQQISPLRTYLRGIRDEGKTIGFVPTMGSFHEGHLSLFNRAKGDCDIVVVSLFVNPTQFGPREDFAAYPRDLNHDLQFASNAGMDALFMPAEEDIYPPGYLTVVDVPELSSMLEGAHRPGHFRGVATIVTKLLNIIHPERAYFGQKDYQQLLIIERLVRDLHLTTGVVAVPTARAQDGMALSSRNAFLTPEERAASTILYRALKHAEELANEGVTEPHQVIQELEALFETEPLVRPEYIAVVHPDTLEPVTTLADGVSLVALAASVGKTRLIDNTMVAPAGIPIPRSRMGKN